LGWGVGWGEGGRGGCTAGGVPLSGRVEEWEERGYRTAPKDFTLQMIYGQALEFPHFTRKIYWWHSEFLGFFE
jgi:hypothetical protein